MIYLLQLNIFLVLKNVDVSRENKGKFAFLSKKKQKKQNICKDQGQVPMLKNNLILFKTWFYSDLFQLSLMRTSMGFYY